MIAQEIAETFKTNTSGGAAIGPGYTYSGHPVGAAAAIACLKETQRPDVKTNAGLRGEQLFKGLWRLGEKYDLIGEVRGGHGLGCALELVSDQTQKTPIDKQTIQRLQTAVYKGSVMLRVSGPNVIFPPDHRRGRYSTDFASSGSGICVALIKSRRSPWPIRA